LVAGKKRVDMFGLFRYFFALVVLSLGYLVYLLPVIGRRLLDKGLLFGLKVLIHKNFVVNVRKKKSWQEKLNGILFS
jgi:hypothetical protein